MAKELPVGVSKKALELKELREKQSELKKKIKNSDTSSAEVGEWVLTGSLRNQRYTVAYINENNTALPTTKQLTPAEMMSSNSNDLMMIGRYFEKKASQDSKYDQATPHGYTYEQLDSYITTMVWMKLEESNKQRIEVLTTELQSWMDVNSMSSKDLSKLLEE